MKDRLAFFLALVLCIILGRSAAVSHSENDFVRKFTATRDVKLMQQDSTNFLLDKHTGEGQTSRKTNGQKKKMDIQKIDDTPMLFPDRDPDERMRAYLARQRRMDDWESPITCDICKTVISVIQGLIEEKKSEEEIVKIVIQMCILFKIEDERVCSMMVPHMKDQVLYVVTNLALAPDEACGIVLGDACSTPYYPGEMWNVTLPDTPKPTPKPPQPPSPSAPKLRVLHFSDIHWDYQYVEGAKVSCNEPICCRANDNSMMDFAAQFKVKNGSDSAGKYGTFSYCDAPGSLVSNFFQYLNKIQDQFDYVLFTGDIPAHDVWNQSQSSQIDHIAALDRMLTTHLPTKPVYYCVGNHESAPINSYPPPGIPGHNTDWLYGTLAGIWGKWLPETALSTILKCGGYSTSPFPGFRIISINNNYCNKGNFWLLLNTTDPCDVLQWLIKELQSAEDKNEKVHILMHIPPGRGACMKAWSYNFYRIVNRYENTIINQFYGHSHHDWFQMFYDDVDFKRPVNFGFVVPSITPGSSGDPVFRIYTIDGNYPNSSWAVLDYQNFYLNITEANLHNDTAWQVEYSVKSAYNMTGLYAADFEDLLHRFEEDDALFQKFYAFYQNMNPDGICDAHCKKERLCDMIEGRSHDPDLCKLHLSQTKVHRVAK